MLPVQTDCVKSLQENNYTRHIPDDLFRYYLPFSAGRPPMPYNQIPPA